MKIAGYRKNRNLVCLIQHPVTRISVTPEIFFDTSMKKKVIRRKWTRKRKTTTVEKTRIGTFVSLPFLLLSDSQDGQLWQTQPIVNIRLVDLSL